MAHDCAASLLGSDSGAVSRTSLSVHTQPHMSDTGRDFLFQGPPPPLLPRAGGIEWVIAQFSEAGVPQPLAMLGGQRGE